MEKYKYEINGKTYVQKKLVLGQVRQLQNFLKEVKFVGNVTAMDFIAIIGERLPEALAIVLIEDGGGCDVETHGQFREKIVCRSPLRDKDVKALAMELEDNVDLDLAVQVIDDFFVCNPIASILERFNAMLEGIGKKMESMTSTNSSSSSAQETLAKEMPSNGDIPSTNANPT